MLIIARTSRKRLAVPSQILVRSSVVASLIGPRSCTQMALHKLRSLHYIQSLGPYRVCHLLRRTSIPIAASLWPKTSSFQRDECQDTIACHYHIHNGRDHSHLRPPPGQVPAMSLLCSGQGQKPQGWEISAHRDVDPTS